MLLMFLCEKLPAEATKVPAVGDPLSWSTTALGRIVNFTV